MIRRRQFFSRIIISLMVIISSGMVFISCHSDDPKPEYKRIKRILVTDLSMISGSTVNRDYSIHLEYDEQNRLVKWTEEHPNQTSVTSLTYSPGVVSMEMDGRALGKYLLNEEGYAVKFERESTKPCTYEYNIDGYLVKSEDGNSTTIYGYASGEFVSWSRGNINGTLVPSKTKDKVAGPAYYQPLRLYILGYSGINPAYVAGLFGKVSQYLPESGEYKNTIAGKEINRPMVFTYEYDKEGYVTRQIEQLTTTGKYAGDTRFEYESISRVD